ncbi:MAG: ABC transporter ATP-binding protein, partial [Scardovia wiggsiae]|nr:ABC transporter ATP-binding protein [Scardovia wiggsiae]
IAGSSLSIMGPSGSGKTTLLHVLAGILRPTQGTVVYKNRDMATLPDAYRTRLRRSDFGFVFQSGQLIEELSAEENVALPLMLSGADYKKAVAAASDWLERLGLQQLASHRPGEMSGGQRQRIAIARALAISPSVIFADEPTGALDQATGEQIIELLTGWCARTGASLIMVTHDPNVARSCQMTIHMQDGRILA